MHDKAANRRKLELAEIVDQDLQKHKAYTRKENERKKTLHPRP